VSSGLTRDAAAPGSPAASEAGVLRAAAVVGAATLASRILGFVRDLVVARGFGAGPVTDAFFVAFRLPNLLRRLLAEGALSSAFIPVFTEYLTTRPRAEVLRMLRAVAGVTLGVLALVSLLGMIGAPVLVRVMAPGFFDAAETGALTVRLTRLMFPYLLLVGLAALAMGVLNAHRHFLVPALAPAMLNLGIIAGVLILAPRLAEPVFGVAIGVLAGGAGQVGLQIAPLARRGVLVAPTLEPRHPAVQRIVRLMGPVTLGQSAAQLNILVDTIIASFLVGGSVSYLYYADRLVEFPLGVFGIAIATAALPTLSEQAARADLAGFRTTFWFALRMAAFVTVPASIALLMLREPLVRVLYQRGEFGPAETTATAWALGFYALGLCGFAGAKIGAQGFYALGDTRTPVRVAMGAMALNSVLAILLARPLAHGGLALATSCSGLANAATLVWLLRRRLAGGIGAGNARGFVHIGVAATGLALTLLAADRGWPTPAPGAAEMLRLGTLVMAGILVYGGIHALLGPEELSAMRDALLARVRRRRLP
jgi:putative peptidoglycan lipid II flippase